MEEKEKFLSPPRGTRDFMPSEALAREKVRGVLEKTFRRYGFAPVETPVLEKFDVLSAKYAGGEEILKETYKLTDQGGRELGLRYDLTVPLCRLVASTPSLAKPFKRYQMASVFRDGPLKTGRYREFVQCDVDTIGASSMLADAEMLAIAKDVFQQLDISVELEVNNRKLLNGLLESAGVAKENAIPVILALDKLEKIGAEGVKKELTEKIDAATATRVVKLFQGLYGKNNEELVSEISKIPQAAEGLEEIKQVMDYCKEMDVEIRFDVSLARGLSYYTGTVFEVFGKNTKITSSLAGGGRYDEMIQKFGELKEKVPAVGISFGLDVILNIIKPEKQTTTTIFVIPIGNTLKQCLSLTAFLRENNVNTAIDLMRRSVSKNFDYTSKQGIPFAAVIGEKEAKENKLTLKNMSLGQEELVTREQALEKLKKNLT